MSHKFKVRIDQQALKHLLEQRVGTPFQQRWVSKLLEFDFIVEYRCGRENKVANAVSILHSKDKDSYSNNSRSDYHQ